MTPVRPERDRDDPDLPERRRSRGGASRGAARILRALPLALLGGAGGALASHHQATYQSQELFFSDYSDEGLTAWLVVGLLGPALLVHVVAALLRPVDEDPPPLRRVSGGTLGVVAAIFASLPAWTAWVLLGEHLRTAGTVPWMFVRADVAIALSIWGLTFGGLLAAWSRTGLVPWRRRRSARATVKWSVMAFALLACIRGHFIGPIGQWQF